VVSQAKELENKGLADFNVWRPKKVYKLFKITGTFFCYNRLKRGYILNISTIAGSGMIPKEK
jgi:hypothetical protein